MLERFGIRKKNLQGKANAAVRTAIKKGILIRPDKCQKCGGTAKVQAHHDDYTKVLDVTWLCPKCHGEHHKINGNGANRIVDNTENPYPALPHGATPAEVADLLRVSVSTLARWRSKGTGPKWFRLGPKMIRYSMADVVEWMKSNGA